MLITLVNHLWHFPDETYLELLGTKSFYTMLNIYIIRLSIQYYYSNIKEAGEEGGRGEQDYGNQRPRFLNNTITNLGFAY